MTVVRSTFISPNAEGSYDFDVTKKLFYSSIELNMFDVRDFLKTDEKMPPAEFREMSIALPSSPEKVYYVLLLTKNCMH
jgi:hypothetical protein